MIFNLLAFGLLFCPLISQAEDKAYDLSQHARCDAVYQPSGCVGHRDSFKDDVQQRGGIVLDRSNQLPPFRHTEVYLGQGQQRTRVVERGNPGLINTQRDIAGVRPNRPSQSQTGEQGSEETSEAGTTGGSSSQGFGQQGGAMGSASVKALPVQIQNPKGGVTTVNGMVYADDDEPKLEKIEAPGTTSQGQLAQALTPQAAVNANRGLDTGRDSSGRDGSGRKPASVGGSGGGTSSQFGQVDNSSAPLPNQSGGGSGITGQLKALASALGNGVMSLAGGLGLGDGGGGSLNGPNHGSRRSQATRLGPDGKPLKSASAMKIDPNLLKDRYGRYISSSKGLEFGASNTHMFNSMCGHYAAYAAKNRIPYDRLGCGQSK